MKKGVTPAKSTIPWMGILNILAAIIYGASPIDFIPDVIILLGWVDDAIAIPIFLAFAVLGFVRHKRAMRKQAKTEQVINVPSREPQIPDSPF